MDDSLELGGLRVGRCSTRAGRASGGATRFIARSLEDFDSPLEKLDRLFQDRDLAVIERVFEFRGLGDERQSWGLLPEQKLLTGHSASSSV
jgi:hypothetical protein